MASILKVDTIQDQDGNNIINESANTITIGASGDTITIPSGATLANSGIVTGFESTGIDDNATSTAITIDSSQQVGIGTASPSHKLDVQGTAFTSIQAKTTGNSSVAIDLDGNSAQDSILRLQGSGTEYYHLQRDGSQSNDLRLFSYTDTAGGTDILRYSINGDLRFGTNATERMRIDSSGNLGIGTTSTVTNTLLNVNGGINSGTGLIGRALNDTFTLNGQTQPQYGVNFFASVGVPSGISGYRGLAFATGSSERMRIDSSGNVGIGETSPSSKLHIKNSGQTIENTGGISNEAINFVYARGGGASGVTVTLATLGTPTTGSFAQARIDWSSIYATNSDQGGAKSEILWLKYKTDGTYVTKEATLGSVGDFINANFYWDDNVLKVDIPTYNDISANITITQHSFSSITINV